MAESVMLLSMEVSSVESSLEGVHSGHCGFKGAID